MNSIYPSKAMSIDEPNQSEFLYQETWKHYITRVTLLATEMFEWKNLPNDIPERFIEKTLFNFGQLAFINDKSCGLMVAKCVQSDSLNLYDEPVAWNCMSTNGYNKDFKTEDIEIIRNNKYSIPTYSIITHHIRRLIDIERTIDSNLYHQRNIAVIKSTESQRLTMQNLMKQYDGHGYMIYGNKGLNLDDIEVLNFKIPYIGLDLESHKERKWNDLINMLGINSANTQKRERLITDEANANNQLIELSADIFLSERKIAVERINKRFNLNIEVSLRKEIRETKEKEVEDNGEIHD